MEDFILTDHDIYNYDYSTEQTPPNHKLFSNKFASMSIDENSQIGARLVKFNIAIDVVHSDVSAYLLAQCLEACVWVGNIPILRWGVATCDVQGTRLLSRQELLNGIPIPPRQPFELTVGVQADQRTTVLLESLHVNFVSGMVYTVDAEVQGLYARRVL